MFEIKKNKIWVDLSKVTAVEADGNETILHIDGRSFTWKMLPQLAFREIERVKRGGTTDAQTP